MKFATSSGLIALAFMALVSACSPPPPPAAPPPPPPPPPINLATKVIEAASAYRYYMDHAGKITPAFTKGDDIAQAVQVGAAYEPKQLLRGAIAYGAIVALQDPAFVAGVRAYAKDPAQRREVTNNIIQNPTYIASIAGASSAAGLVQAALGSEGQRLYDRGKAVKQSAYDLQKQSWSKAEIANRDLRLSQAKALSSVAIVGDLDQTVRLQQAAKGITPLGLVAAPIEPPYRPVVLRAMAVAALAVLGQAGDENYDTIRAIMDEANIGLCLNLAKLNLYQCLAVSRPHYEDIFCLGQHIMMDTGRCMIRAAGTPEPYEPQFVPQIRADDTSKAYKPPSAKKTGKSTSKGSAKGSAKPSSKSGAKSTPKTPAKKK